MKDKKKIRSTRSVMVFTALKNKSRLSREIIDSAISLDMESLSRVKDEIKATGVDIESIKEEYKKITKTKEWDDLMLLHERLFSYNNDMYLDDEVIRSIERLDAKDYGSIKVISKEMQRNIYYEFYRRYYKFKKENEELDINMRYLIMMEKNLVDLKEFCKQNPQLILKEDDLINKRRNKRQIKKYLPK